MSKVIGIAAQKGGVGYTQLGYLIVDDPKSYDEFFEAVGDIFLLIWTRFMADEK